MSSNPMRAIKAWAQRPVLSLLRAAQERLGHRSYAQEGEDVVLLRYFPAKRDGFFVDVGAHHPYRFSNTYMLYKLGWRGVNIDAMPGSMARFRRHRPRDINLEVAIGAAAGSATFFVFNEPALNTFDRDLALRREVPPYRIVDQVTLAVLPLAEVLERAVPSGQTIDLLSVDAEGRDLQVLQSNDWTRFRPTVVLAETLGRRLADLATDPTVAFLTQLGYVATAKTYNTTFLIDATAKLCE